jgi:hypothetical protein
MSRLEREVELLVRVRQWSPWPITAMGSPSDGWAMGHNNHNRRLGTRIDVEPVAAALALYQRPARGLFRNLRSGVVEYPVRIVNISLSGARVEAQDQPVLPHGSIVLLRLNDSESPVRIVGSRESHDGSRVYGLGFGRLDESLEKELHAIIGAAPFASDSWFVYRQAPLEETWGQWLEREGRAT